jgi:hypothetical protein
MNVVDPGCRSRMPAQEILEVRPGRKRNNRDLGGTRRDRVAKDANGVPCCAVIDYCRRQLQAVEGVGRAAPVLRESETIRTGIATAAADGTITNSEVDEHGAHVPRSDRAPHETRTGNGDRADIDCRGAKK